MAEELSFSVDSDWKKQAQEEKRRLAEEAANKKKAAPVADAATPGAGAAVAPSLAAGRRRRMARQEAPEASFTALVQTLASQALLYMGAMAVQGSEPMVDLDTAKQQIDLMAVLEEKTTGNLTADEQAALDVALYETRMRYVSVASRYIL